MLVSCRAVHACAKYRPGWLTCCPPVCTTARSLLAGNNLNGTIPAELGNMTRLNVMYVLFVRKRKDAQRSCC